MERKEELPLEAQDYEPLHEKLILGDAKRSMIGEGKSLIDMDAEMLREKAAGYYVIKQ